MANLFRERRHRKSELYIINGHFRYLTASIPEVMLKLNLDTKTLSTEFRRVVHIQPITLYRESILIFLGLT